MPGYADPQALNHYSYVGNSPVNFTDPTGHMRLRDGPRQDRFKNSVFQEEIRRRPTRKGIPAKSTEDAEVEPLGLPPNLRMPLSELDSEGSCLDISVYAICGSITTDAVLQSGSSATLLPNGITAGNLSSGSAGIDYDGSITMWMGTQTYSNGPVTAYTRLGMQGMPFSLNPARIAGESVVSLREGNTTYNTRGRLTIESRPENQRNLFFGINGAVATFMAGYFSFQGCTNPLTCH